ncbi:MAG: phosphoglycerate kinase [FCB group bacterium]|nr:phosphoglycerate kinase [FCB group bacterium]
MLKSLNSFDLKFKKVLIRVDFNVPLQDGKVVDDFRIRAALPTIQWCLKNGASVILMSHLGRPKGQVVPELSLMPVGEVLAELLEMPVKFSDDCVSEDAIDVTLGLKSGEIHLLENLRFHPEETKNDMEFSALLAKHGQIYINDAFGTAHRAHASNVGVASFFTLKGIGFLVEKELRYLQTVIRKPKRPLVLILGGAKIGSKLGLINKFIEEADTIIIGGGMVFTFLKAKGWQVGGSLVDPAMIDTAKKILAQARMHNVNLLFPTDVVIADAIEATDQPEIVPMDKIPSSKMGLDIGPESVKKFASIIQEAGTVVWNGPMGVFEVPGFDVGSRGIAEALAQAKKLGTITIVGGGDTASAVKKFGLMESMSHVSTGGGASLELLSGNSLPAISILEK